MKLETFGEEDPGVDGGDAVPPASGVKGTPGPGKPLKKAESGSCEPLSTMVTPDGGSGKVSLEGGEISTRSPSVCCPPGRR